MYISKELVGGSHQDATFFKILQPISRLTPKSERGFRLIDPLDYFLPKLFGICVTNNTTRKNFLNLLFLGRFVIIPFSSAIEASSCHFSKISHV